MVYIASNSTRHPARGGQTPGMRGAPVILCSTGSFLLVVGAALLLPGRDINAYRGPAQDSHEVPTAWTARSAPLHLRAGATVRYMASRNRAMFHWRPDCPILTARPRCGWHHRIGTITYAEAVRRRMLPCFYCRERAAAQGAVTGTAAPPVHDP